MAHFIFFSDGGSPKRRGVTYPSHTPRPSALDGPAGTTDAEALLHWLLSLSSSSSSLLDLLCVFTAELEGLADDTRAAWPPCDTSSQHWALNIYVPPASNFTFMSPSLSTAITLPVLPITCLRTTS